MPDALDEARRLTDAGRFRFSVPELSEDAGSCRDDELARNDWLSRSLENRRDTPDRFPNHTEPEDPSTVFQAYMNDTSLERQRGMHRFIVACHFRPSFPSSRGRALQTWLLSLLDSCRPHRTHRSTCLRPLRHSSTRRWGPSSCLQVHTTVPLPGRYPSSWTARRPSHLLGRAAGERPKDTVSVAMRDCSLHYGTWRELTARCKCV